MRDAGVPAPPAGRPERRRAAARAARPAAVRQSAARPRRRCAARRSARRRPRPQLEQVMDRNAGLCHQRLRHIDPLGAGMERHGAHQPGQRPGRAEVPCRRQRRRCRSPAHHDPRRQCQQRAAGRLGVGRRGRQDRPAASRPCRPRARRSDGRTSARQAVTRAWRRPAAAPPDGGGRSRHRSRRWQSRHHCRRISPIIGSRTISRVLASSRLKA